MADNVAITAGSGTSIATDDCGAGGHAQVVKLAISTDGSATLIPADATNGLDVDVIRLPALPTGTNSIGTVKAAGEKAHGTTADGAPVSIGAAAVAHGTNPTAVSAGQMTGLYANRAGVLFTIGGHPNVVCFTTRIPSASGAQTDLAIGPGTVSTGTKVVVTRISVKCSNVNSVNVAAKIGFGATSIPADTTTATGSSGILVDHEGIPPGGGFVEGTGGGILGIGADGEELRFTCDAPTSGHVIVSGSYYTIES
jgi:hypothetical protein